MDISLVVGSVLLLLGTAALVAGAFRAMSHTWVLGVHEVWILPLAGLCLVLVGRVVLG